MTSQWSAQLNAFLVQLSSWDGNGETEADVFHERSILFEALADTIVSDTERVTALEAYIRFLEQSAFQQSSHIEWFWHARGLLMGFRAGNHRREILKAFLDSRNSVLNLYAQVEAWNMVTNNGDSIIKSRAN